MTRYTQDRVAMTVEAMSAIANHVSSIPGRKNMVWISGGLPIQLGAASIGKTRIRRAAGIVDDMSIPVNRLPPADRDGVVKFDEMVKQVADTLNRSNIAMYAIDAKGVELDPTMDVSEPAGLSRDKTTELRDNFGTECRAGCPRCVEAVGGSHGRPGFFREQ